MVIIFGFGKLFDFNDDGMLDELELATELFFVKEIIENEIEDESYMNIGDEFYIDDDSYLDIKTNEESDMSLGDLFDKYTDEEFDMDIEIDDNPDVDLETNEESDMSLGDLFDKYTDEEFDMDIEIDDNPDVDLEINEESDVSLDDLFVDAELDSLDIF